MINLESIDGFMRACQDKNGDLNGHFFKKYITKECRDILDENDITSTQLFYLWKHGINEIPRCPNCGKPLTRKNHFHLSGTRFCSFRCANSYKETIEKKERTTMEHYGVKNPMHIEGMRTKRENIFIEHFGTTSPMKNNDIKIKHQNTIMEHYGVKNPSQIESVKIKKQQTMMEHYGVKNPFQIEEVREKAIIVRRKNRV